MSADYFLEGNSILLKRFSGPQSYIVCPVESCTERELDFRRFKDHLVVHSITLEINKRGPKAKGSSLAVRTASSVPVSVSHPYLRPTPEPNFDAVLPVVPPASPLPVSPPSTFTIQDEDIEMLPVLNDRHHLDPHQNYMLSNPVLTRCGVEVHAYFKTMHCVQCSSAFLPASMSRHLKDHGIQMSKADKLALLDYASANKLRTDHELEVPSRDGPPVQGLKVQDGYACTLCEYAAANHITALTHFSRDHKGEGSRKDGLIASKVQNFFLSKHNYFQVCTIVQVKESESKVIGLFRKELAAKKKASDFLPTVDNPKEVPPLLRITGWHEFLEDVLKSKSAVEQITELMLLPNSKDPGPLARVGELVFKYVEDIREKGRTAPIGVRCVLMEYPRSVSTVFVLFPILTVMS